ncbi:hypothetical protein AKJ09_09199 [Labilithrix luteola]|uniref:Uncharacterized protein n=1 Tax=Labilithrix luteola TaxID=1391654 RepID=A0A0K1Q9R6_9BACT|nr:hypothetical protein AKJ09_09199 [Labilithrix luteola]
MARAHGTSLPRRRSRDNTRSGPRPSASRRISRAPPSFGKRPADGILPTVRTISLETP